MNPYEYKPGSPPASPQDAQPSYAAPTYAPYVPARTGPGPAPPPTPTPAKVVPVPLQARQPNNIPPLPATQASVTALTQRISAVEAELSPKAAVPFSNISTLPELIAYVKALEAKVSTLARNLGQKL
jgi:hypothetical protein